MKRLKFLLERSGAYATILSSKLAKQQEEARERGAAQLDSTATLDKDSEPTPKQLPARRGRTRAAARAATDGASSKKRKLTDADYQLTDYLEEEVK